jgi:hypothetical protein
MSNYFRQPGMTTILCWQKPFFGLCLRNLNNKNMNLEQFNFAIIEHLELSDDCQCLIEKTNGDKFLRTVKDAYESLISQDDTVKILTSSGILAVEKIFESGMSKRNLMQKTVNLLPQN